MKVKTAISSQALLKTEFCKGKELNISRMNIIMKAISRMVTEKVKASFVATCYKVQVLTKVIGNKEKCMDKEV